MSDNIQQPQSDEERRRDDEAIEASAKAQAYIDGGARWGDWERKYSGAGDMAPDGRNIAYWNRSIIKPQFEAIHELNARAREK